MRRRLLISYAAGRPPHISDEETLVWPSSMQKLRRSIIQWAQLNPEWLLLHWSELSCNLYKIHTCFTRKTTSFCFFLNQKFILRKLQMWVIKIFTFHRLYSPATWAMVIHSEWNLTSHQSTLYVTTSGTTYRDYMIPTKSLSILTSTQQ